MSAEGTTAEAHRFNRMLQHAFLKREVEFVARRSRQIGAVEAAAGDPAPAQALLGAATR
jgi:hypothetical protein